MVLKLIKDLTPQEIASICDHTYLNRAEYFRGKAENPVKARQEEFNKFLDETISSKLVPYAICVRHEDVAIAREFFKKNNSRIKIASVVGFPDGNCSTKVKKVESLIALGEGADEIDFVLNYEKLKQGDIKYVSEEIEALAQTLQAQKGLIKMILETSELDNKQIELASSLVDMYELDFIKTSTGFSSAGAKAEHLKIMRENFSGGIKMSGGVDEKNIYELLTAASGRTDGYIDLDPLKIRIGESSLLKKLVGIQSSGSY